MYTEGFLPLARPEGLGAFDDLDDGVFDALDLSPRMIAKVSII